MGHGVVLEPELKFFNCQDTTTRNYYQRSPERLDTVIEDNDTVSDAIDPYAECNVILLPFIIFFLICAIILYVLCKYKLCNKNEDVKKPDDS